MRLLALMVLFSGSTWAAYDANGVELGASEKAVTDKFPGALCKPLQWSSDAADRRCDDSRVVIGGVTGRVTFYLRRDRVEAFDVRFEARDTDRFVDFLKKRYGAPSNETRAKKEERRGGDMYRVQWEKGGERAVLVSQAEKRRGSLTVSRGNFEEEIYKVR